MASNNLSRGLTVLGALLFVAAPLAASVARAISFEEKVLDADSIVVGKCVATRSEWDPEKRWILTYSTFQVDRALKGAALPEVTVVTPGGQVGTLHQVTVGVPHFERGQESLLFVKDSKAGPTVLYLDQGAYDVVRDARGEVTVRPASSSLVLVDGQTGTIRSAEPPRPLRLFEREVRDALQRGDRGRIQRYGVVPAQERPTKSAATDPVSVLKQYRILIGAVLLLLAISTYLLFRGR